MRPSIRTALAAMGLLGGLCLSVTATAAPFKLPKKPPSKTFPKNPVPVDTGLTSTRTVDVRSLYASGVSMNIHRAPRIVPAENRAQLDSKSQMWLHFRGAARKTYDLDCRFTGSGRVEFIDYSNGKVHSNHSVTIVRGVTHVRLSSTSTGTPRKVFVQGRGNLDWHACTIKPVR